MKLIIREYLSMLKESGELDALLPDLLLAIGIEPLTKAQIGVRQFGVDVSGVGHDLEDGGKRKLFLLTIKQGDIGRDDWDGTPQSLRSSLDEIQDVFININVAPVHQELTKKIVVCTGGELKQEVQTNWTQYISRSTVPGKIEFDFWGGDKLSLYIERFLLDEFLFPESARKKIRKTLALVGQSEYNLSHFFELIEEILFGFKNLNQNKFYQKTLVRLLNLVNLCVNIVFRWSEEENNLEPAHLAAERTLLRTWDWMREFKLTKRKKIQEEYYKLYETYLKVETAYFSKLKPYCYIKDGLSGYIYDKVGYPIRIFKVIGNISLFGINQLYLYSATQDEVALENVLDIVDVLINLIQNNPFAYSPCYDEHSIDICIALLLLTNTPNKDFAKEWIEQLIFRICFAYRCLGKYFPISSDSYDDLISLHTDSSVDKEKLMHLSTLLPMLAEWCVVLKIPDTYENLRNSIINNFPNTDLQLWYPDEATDSWLYKKNASLETGGMASSIDLPPTLDELEKRIHKIQEQVIAPETTSSFIDGFPNLSLIASRHFRTPVMPFYWQRMLVD
jgi:hypothetical protein